VRLVRAQLFHTPANPFRTPSALEAHADGGLALAGGRVLACGDFDDVRRRYPAAEVVDARGSVLLPGLVDTHVHYPQLPIIGAMGMRLLAWLEQRTLPHEEAFADAAFARAQARIFLRHLARNGTTSALVFGAHFAGAMDAFFAEAERSGLRITAGLVVSDVRLTAALHTTPERAFNEGLGLIERWHGRGRLRYAVTPRFSLSCSEALLEACGELFRQVPDLVFTSHLNETPDEIAAVRKSFPWAQDYLATYERYGLVARRSVFAHDVHPTDGELARLSHAQASVAHCPSSNSFIGSGLFPLRRHLEHSVRVALGSDVGGGTGLSLLKEGLEAYQHQMLREDGYLLTPAHLLYLATRAGAEALGLDTGDFVPGKRADFVLLRPPPESTLEAVLAHSPSAEAALGALFTLAREESVEATYVSGEAVYTRATDVRRPAGSGTG
jgi:guanine deaminase